MKALFDIACDVHVELTTEDASDPRYKVVATFKATDDGADFCEAVNTWYNMTQDGVDVAISFFERTLACELPYRLENVSETQLVQVEAKLINVLTELNNLGKQAVGLERSKKHAMNRAIADEMRAHKKQRKSERQERKEDRKDRKDH